MQRNIQVMIRLDPTEYNKAEDTAKGAIDVVSAILQGLADFPVNNDVDIICEEERVIVKMNPVMY